MIPKQVGRHGTLQDLIARGLQNSGTPDTRWPPCLQGAPLEGLMPTTTNTQSHSLPRRTLSHRVLAPPWPSRATLHAQIAPLGDQRHYSTQGLHPHEASRQGKLA